MSEATDRQWFGHPRGLMTLFFTEMWERFSYYGMRAILILFMTTPVIAGGFGWSAAKAGPIYGLYTAMVYMTAVPGGWIADRLIGQRRAVFIGGVIITLGHISLMFHGIPPFYLGLFLIVLGTGLLKPNISSQVGQLYKDQDARRDAGFSIFYMGINLGAFGAPLACGFLAQHPWFKGFLENRGWSPESSWHWAFGAAAVGMTFGLLQYVLTGKNLGNAGLVAPGRGDDAQFARNKKLFLTSCAVLAIVIIGGLVFNADSLFNSGSVDQAVALEGAEEKQPALVRWMGYLVIAFPIGYFIFLLTQKGWSEVERKRIYAIPVFFFAAALFWSAFEQAGSTMTLFAEQFTDNSVAGLSFPSSWWQSANALFIVLLAAPFALLWTRLGEREPSSPAKFSGGLFLVGIGFLVLAFGAMFSGPEGGRVSPLWLLAVYFLHTVGELCLSPVGLSTMTKLAPARISGQMMGVWFMAAAVGNYVGGQVAGLFDKFPLPQLFGAVFVTSVVVALAMAAIVKPVRRLMGGVH